MITQEEFVALSQLLQRTLMSAAEAQWTRVFMARLQAALIQQTRAMDEEKEPERRDERGSTLDRAAARDALPIDAAE